MQAEFRLFIAYDPAKLSYWRRASFEGRLRMVDKICCLLWSLSRRHPLAAATVQRRLQKDF
jgi:hypothetical protein